MSKSKKKKNEDENEEGKESDTESIDNYGEELQKSINEPKEDLKAKFQDKKAAAAKKIISPQNKKTAEAKEAV